MIEWKPGDPPPYADTPEGCQHYHIDNQTGKCKACDTQMLGVRWQADTVLSAPNLAGCVNPACVKALEDGGYDETNPPAGCTNPSGLYIEDRSRARQVPIGWNVTYECNRCQNNGTVFTAHEPVQWDCGHDHRGDYVHIPRDPGTAGGNQ